MLNRLFYIFVMLLLPIICFAQNDQQTSPCSSPEATQFDFWVGDWLATWEDGEGKVQTGSNKIERILGGCALQENFSTSDGSFKGKSFSVFNSKESIWEQTWVDNSGGYLTFTGGIIDDKMILSRDVTTKDGKKISQRMVFYEINPDKFTWDWENSTDGGQTWSLQWRINYTRKN